MGTVSAFQYERATPEGYVCTKCGASGCKLWRPIHTDDNALCGQCLDPTRKEIGLDGKAWYELIKQRTDQVQDKLPWVPCEDGNGTWGYTSVPEAGVRWWKSLPSYPILKDKT